MEIRKVLYGHPKVLPDIARIRFVQFGESSLDLDIFAYIDVTDYGEYHEVAEDLPLRIMGHIAKAGSVFPLPQTRYVEWYQRGNRYKLWSENQRVPFSPDYAIG